MPFIPRRRRQEEPEDRPEAVAGDTVEQPSAAAQDETVEQPAAAAPADAAPAVSQDTSETELDLPDEPAKDPVSWGFDEAEEERVEVAAEREEQPVVAAATNAPTGAPPAGGVSVVREEVPVDPDDEYAWHTGVRHPTGQPDAVEFVETHKAFGRNRILRGLNMGLPEGMISMILGPSGTGKSVCIKHMVGLLYPDEGDVLVHGDSVPSMPLEPLLEMRKKFGVLFQDGALFGSMNIFDNVAFPLRQHTDKGEDEIKRIVDRRMDEVGLGHSWDKFPNELSGGMRKRAGFARALVLDPSIVLFDEPDSGLDPVRTALLGELIMEIHEETMREAEDKRLEHRPAFTLITHDIMTARRVSQYINVLWKGRIVEAGPAEQLFNSPNAFVEQFLAGASRGPLGMN